MTAPTLIALCGAAGVGKSTVARALESRGYVRHPFAGPLKETVQRLWGLTSEHTDGKLKGTVLPNGLTPRQLMQRLGTDVARGIDPGVWLGAWERSLPDCPVVVDDCRFPNEAALVRQLGGQVWLLERPGREYPIGEVAGLHESEWALHSERWDATLSPRPTLADAALALLED